MAKRYKNALEREKEEKKKMRREQMKKQPKKEKISKMQQIFIDLKEIADDKTISDEQKTAKFLETDAKMAELLVRVSKRREDINKEIVGRGATMEQESYERLTREDRKLEKEEKVLQNFPKLREQILHIMSIKDDIKEKKVEKADKANVKVAEAKAKVDRAKEVDKKLEEIENKRKEYYKKAELDDNDRKELNDLAIEGNKLLKEKSEMSMEKLEADLKDAKKEANKYKEGKSNEDSMIAKCDMAWKMLAAGKTWDDIVYVKIEDVQERKEESKKQEETAKTEETKQEVKPEEVNPVEPTEMSQEEYNAIVEEAKKSEVEYTADDTRNDAEYTTDDTIKEEETNGEEKQEIAEEEKNNLPANQYVPFAERHKIISRIPLLGKRIAKRADEWAMAKQEQERKEKLAEKIANGIEEENVEMSEEEFNKIMSEGKTDTTINSDKQQEWTDRVAKAMGENVSEEPEMVEEVSTPEKEEEPKAEEAKNEEPAQTQTEETKNEEPKTIKEQRDNFMAYLREMVEQDGNYTKKESGMGENTKPKETERDGR